MKIMLLYIGVLLRLFCSGGGEGKVEIIDLRLKNRNKSLGIIVIIKYICSQNV